MGAAHFWSFPHSRPVGQIRPASCVSAGLPAFLYDLCFIVEEEISRERLPSPPPNRRNPAESDTLNLICASHLFARCGYTVTGGVVVPCSHAPRSGPWPTCPSSACLLTLPGDPGSRGPGGLLPPGPLLVDKQLLSCPEAGLGSCSEWPFGPLGQGWHKEIDMGLVQGSWVWGTKLPQPLTWGSPQPGSVLPQSERSPPNSPPPGRQGALETSRTTRYFPRGSPGLRLSMPTSPGKARS